MGTPSPLSVVLWTTDIEALTGFLERVAGFVVRARHPGFAALTLGDAEVLVHDDEAYRGHPWYDALRREGAARGIGAELRFRVTDVDAAFREALAAGGIAVQPPYDSGAEYECQVMGPDGYLVTLWRPSSGTGD